MALRFTELCKRAPETINNQVTFHKIYKYGDEPLFCDLHNKTSSEQ